MDFTKKHSLAYHYDNNCFDALWNKGRVLCSFKQFNDVIPYFEQVSLAI